MKNTLKLSQALLLIIIFLFNTDITKAQNPAGIVTNPVLWQKDIKTEDYKDRNTDLFNFHTYKYFNEDRDYLKLPIEKLNRISLFMVFFQEQPSDILNMQTGNGMMTILDNVVSSRAKVKYEGNFKIPQFITYQEYFLKQRFNNNKPFLIIGDKEFKEKDWLQGGIAEIILYDMILDKSERSRVESYLSLKYGISLPDTSDYYLSDGTLVHEAALHQKYNKRVTGILKDKLSSLNQMQSVNIKDSLRLTIGFNKLYELNDQNLTKIGDKTGLLWSDDNGQLQFSDDKKYGFKGVMNRKWQWRTLKEQGNDLPDVEIRIDASKIKGYDPKQSMWMVIDRTTSSEINYFTTDMVPMQSQGNGIWTCKASIDGDLSGSDVFSFIQGNPFHSFVSFNTINCDENMMDVQIRVNTAMSDVNCTLVSNPNIPVLNEQIKGSLYRNITIPYGMYELSYTKEGEAVHKESIYVDKQLCKNAVNEEGILPNPVKAGEPFMLKQKISPDSKIMIYNEQGQLIKEIYSGTAYFSDKLENAGIYFIKVNPSSTDEKTYKLIVFK